MRFYTGQHRYYCGIDLHARRMYICVLDAEGQVRLHRNGPATPEHFLATIAAYREDLVVAVECIFAWYWVADLCAHEGIAFVLGHALYMKAIHGSKAKNDRIDAHKIAVLLRGGMLPMAYVYPREMRATRDLLRRRCYFMRKRAELLTHVQNTASQYTLPTFGKKIAYKANGEAQARLAEHRASICARVWTAKRRLQRRVGRRADAGPDHNSGAPSLDDVMLSPRRPPSRRTSPARPARARHPVR